jgi:hypothetical protein
MEGAYDDAQKEKAPQCGAFGTTDS